MTSTPPLLHVQDLTLAAAQSGALLIHDLTFDIAPSEIVAIVGESGSGKSLTARAILGLLPSGVELRAGQIDFEGTSLNSLTKRDYRRLRGRDIGMIFQEPMVSLNPALKIGDQLAEGLALHKKLTPEDCRDRAIEMLKRVQIRNPEKCLSAYPHEFSGGMRQRIMLASVFLLEPKLVIADEPTTALDTLAQKEVMDLMAELARERDVATLLITHDLGLVSRYAERTIVLEKGFLREVGKTEDVLSRPQHPYTQELVASLPSHSTKRKDAQVQAQGKTVISVENMQLSYPGKAGLLRKSEPIRVIQDVSLDIAQGEIVALVGASGSGKSTLGRAIVGLAQPNGGRILFEGEPIDGMSGNRYSDYRSNVQLIFQDPFSSLDPKMTVGDSVTATLRNLKGWNRNARRERAKEILAEVGLKGFEDRYPHQMSGGQRQRVAIARAVISKPKLVVADEAVSALDMTVQAQVLSLLENLQDQYGFACLFITHDLAVVEQIASRVIVLDEGKIVEQGASGTVLANPQHPYTRALIDASPKLMTTRS